MILDVDIGNTRIKWLLQKNDKVVRRGAFVAEELESFFMDLSKDTQTINRVRVASVRPTLHALFDHYCRQYWQLQPEYAIVTKQFEQVVNAYENISQMGVDRWLAIIAASRICESACLVVSAGSALTVDLLDDKQQHLGGFITPGLQLMKQSLYRDTDQVKLDDIDYDAELQPGCSTRQAVSAGLVLMQLGLLQQSINIFEPDKATLLITGGDGARLEQYFLRSKGLAVREVVFEPDLVFRGLSLAL